MTSPGPEPRPANGPADGPPPSGAGDGPQPRAAHGIPVRPTTAGPGPDDAVSWAQALRPMRRRGRGAGDNGPAARLVRGRTGGERRAIVSLVVDAGRSMALWSGTAERFAGALARSRAFRDVRVYRWPPARRTGRDDRAADAEAGQRTGRSAPADLGERTGRTVGGDGAPRLPDAPGRHVVLVLTDLHGDRWADGTARHRLARWAKRASVAVVNVLPEHLWSRGPVPPHKAALTSPGPFAANGRWSWRPDDFALVWQGDVDFADPRALPVPVLELTGQALHRWGRFVAHAEPEAYEARIVTASLDAPTAPTAPTAPSHPTGPTAPTVLTDVLTDSRRQHTPPRPPPATELVRRARARLSPTTRHLAQLCAAVPLNLRILELVRRTLLPEARTWHLAELLHSGLLRYVAPAPALPDPARIELEFVDGVRGELLAEGTRDETARAIETVLGHFAGAVPEPLAADLRQVRAVVRDPGRAAHLPVERVRPWLVPVLPALTALGGRYALAASGLRARLWHGAAPPGVRPPEVREQPEQRDRPHLTPAPVGERVVHTPRMGGNVSVGDPQPLPAAHREKARKPPPVWGNVPPRNRAFTGRRRLLEELHQRLQEGTTAVIPEALQGMGGVGKTQLAVEYVYRHMHEYQIVWWIPAEQPQQIRQSLVELAGRLELDISSGEAATAVPAVIEALRIGEPDKNWLLVFDNAETPDVVRDFFPADGPGRILVTSRNGQWASAARPLEVDVFTREESRALLQLRLPDLDDASADRIAETLGDLPLGVEQAATWLAETGMPADEYLRLFEQHAMELMAGDPPPDYPLSVAAAWNLSLERLQRDHPAALQLLQVCAFFAPEPISRPLLTGVRDAPVPPELAYALSDPIRLGRAVRDINRYALARINHSTNTIQLHRLVQRVLINQMPDELKVRMRAAAHRLLAHGDPTDPSSPEQWQRYGELLPHVLSSRAVTSGDRWVRQLVLNEIEYMFYWGDYEGSGDLAREAYETWRDADGENNEHALRAAKLYGDNLRALGHHHRAYELDQRTRAAMTETLGTEDENTLEITSMLAWDLRMRGDFTGASELDGETFEASRRIFGPNDVSTLIFAHRVALNLRLTGDFRQALELDQDTHRRKVEELGENALSTLHTLAGIAMDLRQAGQYTEAYNVQQDVSRRYEYHFGATNPSTIGSQLGLAQAERRMGRHARAMELSGRALKQYRIRYGDNYPETLAALLTHAIDVRYSGDFRHALELSEEGCEGYARLYGPGHPHTLGARINHAVALRLLGRVEDARRLNEQILDQLRDKLGPEHPNVLACASNLAADLYELGEVRASVELSTRTLERARTRLGEDHPATLATAVNLSLGLRMLGRDEEADTLHTDTLARYARVLGPDHPALAAARDSRPANCDVDPMPL
ncbi:FxSxx-COOH system tetratricopeptide repeat protein [Streptomyces thermospinosisporus]|uniref:FxSxx-COOH system tetratricopeptide repeat protein n=1 Tax=Streptomyces thermospinosisporus TaxID=161482 RepID=A0ABN1YLV0_9ACTN